MDGSTKTSTQDVAARPLQSPCLKSKTLGTASAATLTLSSNLALSLLVIVVRCCSTCLAKGTSLTKEQARRYGVAAALGHVLVEVPKVS
jgi:hypothetical protein